MTYKTKRRRKATLNANHFKCEYENDPIGLLAAEIVMHAIADWRDLVRARAWENESKTPSCSFTELRAFFNGEWCDFLMMNFDVTPAGVLKILENELAEAMLQPPKKKKQGKG